MQYTKPVTIGDVTYKLQKYPPKKALKLLAQLTKLVGVPLAHFFVGMKDDAAKVLPIAVEALASRMDEDGVVDLVVQLVSCAIVDGVSVAETFDTHFQGRIGHLFKLVTEIVKFQYEDFLSVAVSAGLKEMAQAKSHQSI
jgi:hypothetical protein